MASGTVTRVKIKKITQERGRKGLVIGSTNMGQSGQLEEAVKLCGGQCSTCHWSTQERSKCHSGGRGRCHVAKG